MDKLTQLSYALSSKMALNPAIRDCRQVLRGSGFSWQNANPTIVRNKNVFRPDILKCQSPITTASLRY